MGVYYSRAIGWLAKSLGFEPEILKKFIAAEYDKDLYRVFIKKIGSKERKIHQPCEELGELQSRIDQRLLKNLPVSPSVFGFSGGGIEMAIRPHLFHPALWRCDIKDAFPSVRRHNVVAALGRYFSKGATECLASLCTTRSGQRLPQGAPTSPRLFDLCLKIIDRQLLALAKKLGGRYTRFADNLFFSAPTNKIAEAEKEILSWLRMAELTPHKIGWRRLTKPEAIRLLGLNIIKRQVHNIRTFKRQLRLSVHHVGRLLDLGMKGTPKFKAAWRKLQGQMGSARKNTLPKGLLDSYLELKKRIK